MTWINIKDELPKRGKYVLVYCLPDYMHKEGENEFEINVGYMEDYDEWYLDSKNLDEIHSVSFCR